MGMLVIAKKVSLNDSMFRLSMASNIEAIIKSPTKISKGITRKTLREGSRKINLKSVKERKINCLILLRFNYTFNENFIDK